jgi:hypothetical protein
MVVWMMAKSPGGLKIPMKRVRWVTAQAEMKV